jgi:hypothetical protein
VPLCLFVLIASSVLGTGCGSSEDEDSDSDTTYSEEVVVAAAEAFLGTLSVTEADNASYDFTSANAFNWSNLPIDQATRNGVQFSALTEAQQTAALAVIEAALSSSGYELFNGIRDSDEYLATVGNPNMFGAEKYFIAILGTPSTSVTWMLQFGGHHGAFNITYGPATTSFTPMFVGMEPGVGWSDSSGSHDPVETQRTAVDTLYQSLSSNTSAVISGTFTDVVNGPNGPGNHDGPGSTTAVNQSYPTSGRGVAVSSLSAAQKELVKDVIEAWVNTVPSSLATEILGDYESDAALSETYVGFKSGSNFSAAATTVGSYLRVDGPRVWIECVVQSGFNSSIAFHYHTLWRDKEQDYGAEF